MTYYPPDTNYTQGPLVVTTFFGVIALLSCGVRFYVLKVRRDKYAPQDWLILGALFCVYVSLGIQWACVVHGGVGRHITDLVSPADAVITLKLIIPFEVLYGITIMMIKFSILLFYVRLFGSAPSFVLTVRIFMGIIFCWQVSITLETFLLCRPLAFNWDSTVPGGVCGDRNAAYIIAGALNVGTDLMVMLLPMPNIWKLQMPMSQRLGLVGIFGIGVFVTAISVIRIFSLMDISFTDPTFTLPMGLLWTVLEPELAIIIANASFIRSFLRAVGLLEYFSICATWTSRKGTRGTSKFRSSKFEEIPSDAQQLHVRANSKGAGVELQTIGGSWKGSANGSYA